MEKYFSFDVLRRGYDYYKKGKVKELKKAKNKYIAKVSGTTNYKVSVDLTENPYSMKCTCHYSLEGNCKHMAAVLYSLKNDTLLLESKEVKINVEEIKDYASFEKIFKREYYKLFHNRTYIQENELEDYVQLITAFTNEVKKQVGTNNELAYEVFEYLLINIDGLDVYDEYGEKKNLFDFLLGSFHGLLEDARIFVRFLAFILTIYTMDVEEFYFEHKEYILDLLYHSIESKWQTEEFLNLLKKLDNDKYIYEYEKNDFKVKEIYLLYHFVDKEEALALAQNNLQIKEVCEFLLDVYKEDIKEQVSLLKKMIQVNKGYSSDKYYQKLVTIYEKNYPDDYLDLLREYFTIHGTMEIYLKIKKCYSGKEWHKVRKEYLSLAKNSKLYRDICVEEGFYYNLIDSLKSTWIETINEYLPILIANKPKEILNLYKEKLIEELDTSSCRQHYQKMLNNFRNMLQIPNGKEEFLEIIDYAKENYKNRNALQEELDFFVETYM